jgi:hypothetical protein
VMEWLAVHDVVSLSGRETPCCGESCSIP